MSEIGDLSVDSNNSERVYLCDGMELAVSVVNEVHYGIYGSWGVKVIGQR